MVALAGDGGLTMLFGELITLTQNRLPVKVIVFNNSSLNFVELEMKAAGHRQFRHRPAQPELRRRRHRRWASSAAASSIPPSWSRRVVDAFAYDGPAVVDVVTARQELSIPPAITVEQAKGFSLYAIRTILAGRGDELLDLVTTNVARRILD